MKLQGLGPRISPNPMNYKGFLPGVIIHAGEVDNAALANNFTGPCELCWSLESSVGEVRFSIAFLLKTLVLVHFNVSIGPSLECQDATI